MWKVGADGKSGTLTPVPAPSQHSNDCVGFSFLPDGRLLIVGGPPGCSGLDQATIFDWTKAGGAPWSLATPMHKDRWYPSATTLGDGRILVTLGNIGDGNAHLREPFPEIYDPATNLWQVLWNAPFPGCPCTFDDVQEIWVCDDCPGPVPTYPPMFLLTDGRVFFAHWQGNSKPRILNLNIDPPAWDPEEYLPPNSSTLDRARYCTFGPDKILRVGRGVQEPIVVSGATMFIDFGVEPPAEPEWVWDGESEPSVGWTLNRPRSRFALVLLPTGYVMATGGADAQNNAVDEPEWIDPNKLAPGDPFEEQWRKLAVMHHASTNQHRLAILLPDARVLSASGDGQKNAEVFSPPYLYVGDAEADRPIIHQAPGQVTYDTEFRISFDTENTEIGIDDIDDDVGIVLMGLGAMTHGFDQNQRRVVLDIVTKNVENNWISVKSPLNGNHAPPGYYMLFAVSKKEVVNNNKHRIPSVATFIRLVIDCPGCPGDLNDDDAVGIEDLLLLLSCWGPVASGCEDADLNGDGDVGVPDLLMLLAAWGPCATCGGESVPLTLEDCWERYHDDIGRYEQCVEWVEERETYYPE